MRELNTFLLGQIASDVREIKQKIEDSLTWAQRIGIILALWAGAVGINLSPDKLGEVLARLIK